LARLPDRIKPRATEYSSGKLRQRLKTVGRGDRHRYREAVFATVRKGACSTVFRFTRDSSGWPRRLFTIHTVAVSAMEEAINAARFNDLDLVSLGRFNPHSGHSAA
jgi:hypothetical protein